MALEKDPDSSSESSPKDAENLVLHCQIACSRSISMIQSKDAEAYNNDYR